MSGQARRARRTAARLAVCILLALSSAQAAWPKPLKLSAPKLSGVPLIGGYSVDGKKGPFVKQVAGRNFEGAATQNGALALASDAVNRGELKSAILSMPQTELQVRAMLTKLDGRWPYAKSKAVTIHIVGLPDYFAEALPDGSMMVHLGLIERAQSDDEVAFILGHELGHIRLAHFVNASGFQQQRRAITMAAQIFTAGAAFSQIKASNAGGMLSLTMDPNNPTVLVAVNKAAVVNDDLHLFLNVFVEPAWSRAQEDEADALGYDLSSGAGYSADTASSRVFDNIQADFDARQATIQAMQTQAKETMSAAVEGLSKTLQNNQNAAAALEEVKGSLEQGVRDKAFGVVAGIWSQKHRNPQARRKGLGDYSSRAYPASAQLVEEQHAWLDQVRASREYAQAKIAVDAVAKARALSDQGKFDEAAFALGPALKSAFGGSSLVINVQAGIYRGKGDVTHADQAYTKVETRGDQSIDGYVDHVDMLVEAKRYDRATQVIKGALERMDNDDKPFLPDLITISLQTGKQQEGINYLSQCVGYSDPGLTRLCVDAASGLTDDQRKKLSPSQQAQLDRLRRDAASKAAVGASPVTALFAPKPATP